MPGRGTPRPPAWSEERQHMKVENARTFRYGIYRLVDMAYIGSLTPRHWRAMRVFRGKHQMWMVRAIKPKELALSLVIAAAIFAVVGTVTALWDNPLFIRMVPSGPFEIGLLSAQSLLAGLYLGTRAPSCAAKMAGTGSVFAFLGVACPICNKALMLIFGAGLLLAYLEPVRLYLGALGLALIGYATWRKLRPRYVRTSPPALSSSG